MRNYWDFLGRLHSKPVTETNSFPCNNAYTYSFYYKVLRHGLIKRQPELPFECPFSRHHYKPGQPPISHDEVTGVCGLSKNAAKTICEYLENNHNQFCDIPDFKPIPFYKLNWFKVIPALISVFKAENQRHETLKHPVIHPIAFWQQPQYRWVYKRAAGITPSLWEKLMFVVLRLVSIMRWKKEDPNLLLYFSLEHLDQNSNLGIEGKFVDRLLQNKILKLYSSIEDMMRHKTRDVSTEYQEDHPFFIKD